MSIRRYTVTWSEQIDVDSDDPRAAAERALRHMPGSGHAIQNKVLTVTDHNRNSVDITIGARVTEFWVIGWYSATHQRYKQAFWADSPERAEQLCNMATNNEIDIAGVIQK